MLFNLWPAHLGSDYLIWHGQQALAPHTTELQNPSPPQQHVRLHAHTHNTQQCSPSGAALLSLSCSNDTHLNPASALTAARISAATTAPIFSRTSQAASQGGIEAPSSPPLPDSCSCSCSCCCCRTTRKSMGLCLLCDVSCRLLLTRWPLQGLLMMAAVVLAAAAAARRRSTSCRCRESERHDT